MTFNINIIRLFVRSVRWFSVNHRGSIGETAIQIGIINGGAIFWDMETEKFVEMLKNEGNLTTTADQLTVLLSGIGKEYMSSDLITAIEAIEAAEAVEDAVYLNKSDPGRVNEQFRDKTGSRYL